MSVPFEKPQARLIDQRYGAHPSRAERDGLLALKDQRLTIDGKTVMALPLMTAGCVQQTADRKLVILLAWGLFTRIEIPVDSAEEGRHLLEATGLGGAGRTMSFEVLTPTERPKLKALGVNLGTWAVMAAVGMAVAFGVRALGYELPRWAFTLAMLPLALCMMAFIWRAYTTPLTLGAQGLELGRGDARRQISYGDVEDIKMVDDGVNLTLAGGETLHLKTLAAPNAPDPQKDVLFGAIVAARATTT
jgi:hypothetical protein